MVAVEAGPGGPVEDRFGPDRLQAGGPPARPAPLQTLQAFGLEDRPHRLGRYRAALGAERGGDLGDGKVPGAQHEHTVSHSVSLAWSFGPGFGGAEEARPPGPQLRRQLMHRGGRVAETCADLLGRGVVDEVGAQGLIPPLRRLAGLEEVCRPDPHDLRRSF